MRDNLPKKPLRNECAILNLQTMEENGSHWVTYVKHKNMNGADDVIIYFDSFGNLQPPKELVNYLGPNIQYNYDSFQNYNTVICGHLCLIFLYEYWKKFYLK